MKQQQYVGLDVSLEQTSICVVDDAGATIWRGKCRSTPESIQTVIAKHAPEAVRIGLVDRVVPDTELWSATMDIARTISGNAPLAVQAAKITIAQELKDPDKRDMDAIKAIGTACMDSEDFREGRRAFMEKRKPQFKGR